jgi:excisionase family DNA binding protein
MRERLSPKQVARAIGVSESSLKRWCDRGLIPFERTAGGHRRMVMTDVVSFLRSGGYKVVQPDLLSLPATSGQTEWTLDQARERFLSALVEGQEEACRRIVVDLFLSGHSPATIGDQVIAEGFRRVGNLWECGDLEVYEERRGCELCLRIVHELRGLQEPPADDAPVALGATVDGDPYTLAVSLAEVVLREAGYRATSLGHMLPFSTLHVALAEQRPQLMWLSVSSIRDEAKFADEVNRLYDACLAAGAALVLGGRALTEEVRRQLRYSAYCDTFLHLKSCAETLLTQSAAAASR